MNVLVIGGGGREHALCWKLKQSAHRPNLYCAPGNAGTASLAENVTLDLGNFDAVAGFCRRQNVEVVVLGPEAPIVEGLADYLRISFPPESLTVIGPNKAAAALEGSKRYAKEFMQEAGIPTARHKSFQQGQEREAIAFLAELAPPYVLKADGLAGGKGVIILEELNAAQEEVSAMLNGKFGEASSTLVIEEFLQGREFSVFLLTDGSSYRLLPPAVDYKRRQEGDQGLNTGGMGAVSPVSFYTEELAHKTEERIIKPTLKHLQERKLPYCGFLFLGLMEVEGDPYVIEYNVRLGDPETQVVLPRIEEDLLDSLLDAGRQELRPEPFKVSSQHAATVVAVMQDYPEPYPKGQKITGLEEVKDHLAQVFHAGTTIEENEVLTSGGRVLAFTGMGASLEEALQKSYRAAKTVCFDGIDYRQDIGQNEL